MEDAVELARVYEADPLLAVRDLRRMFGPEIRKVFRLSWRERPSVSGELPELEG